MKLFIARLFAVILIAVSIIDACAWSGPGHMTVAAIAYRDLSPAERQKLDTILESHPQFESWRNAFPESVPNLDQGLYVAMAASLWPDQIRNRDDPSTFPNWHFIDYPLIAPSFPDRGSPTPQDDKVRYIGCSNFSGWHLMKSLAVSEKHGFSRYVAHQAYYSLVGRDYEWELMPLALDQKIGTVVWSPLGWGGLTGKIRRGQPLPEISRLHSQAIVEAGLPVSVRQLCRCLCRQCERLEVQRCSPVSHRR
jgi:hypothetical protein